LERLGGKFLHKEHGGYLVPTTQITITYWQTETVKHKWCSDVTT